MSQLKLDKTKPHAQIFGDLEGRGYEQDGRYFRGDGTLWRDPKAKETDAERKAREAAEKAEAERLAAEVLAAASGEGNADAQLSKQLGS